MALAKEHSDWIPKLVQLVNGSLKTLVLQGFVRWSNLMLHAMNTSGIRETEAVALVGTEGDDPYATSTFDGVGHLLDIWKNDEDFVSNYGSLLLE